MQREKVADPDIQLVCDDSNIFKWTALIKVGLSFLVLHLISLDIFWGEPLFWRGCLIQCSTVQGPSETPFDGGVFQLAFSVPEQYPLQPPQVRFLTKIFHPNVHFKVIEVVRIHFLLLIILITCKVICLLKMLVYILVLVAKYDGTVWNKSRELLKWFMMRTELKCTLGWACCEPWTFMSLIFFYHKIFVQ